ncbi:MAG: Fe-S cluster assembly protein SufD [Bacteroidaceae bacterium]|nr:Fe-S cluster assembly protein SufD [Bacteroidaceae bacterium]
MNSAQQYIDLYASQRDLICKHSAPVMNAVRDAAMEQFQQSGFPSLKEERFRYTDVAKAFAPDYGVNLNRVQVPINPREVFRCDVPNLSTHLAYVVNDQPLFERDIPYVSSLRQACIDHPELVAKYYNKAAAGSALLNTAFAQDGLFVYVPKNQRMERPLQVLNLLRSGVDMMVNRRLLIVLEEGADATLLLCDHALERVSFLTTQVIEVFCADRSRLDLYELEETHTSCHRFSNLYIHVGSDCVVSHNSITLYNGLTRNTTDVVLDGQRSEVTLNGCVVADKSQHVDNNTLVDHRAPSCTSRQLYKYVVDEQAVGAFAGKMLVRKEAQKTDSKETNANLCATSTARMYTQPMLEIYADDVQCSHGSTVGVLDEQALFYMQQRGISEAEARLLLKNAFVGQVIEQVRLQPLRDRLHHLIDKRFRGELNKCTGCALCK